MLDIKLIRENPDKINELLKRRNPDLSINGVIKIDEDKYFLIGFKEGKLFAWILIGLATISLAFVIIPFFI